MGRCRAGCRRRYYHLYSRKPMMTIYWRPIRKRSIISCFVLQTYVSHSHGCRGFFLIYRVIILIERIYVRMRWKDLGRTTTTVALAILAVLTVGRFFLRDKIVYNIFFYLFEVRLLLLKLQVWQCANTR